MLIRGSSLGANGKVALCVIMKPDQITKIGRDILAMLTGSGGVIIMALNRSWDWGGLLICAILLGIPLVNLRTLLSNGESNSALDLTRLARENRPAFFPATGHFSN